MQTCTTHNSFQQMPGAVVCGECDCWVECHRCNDLAVKIAGDGLPICKDHLENPDLVREKITMENLSR